MRAVRQFHFHGWPEIGIPAEGKGMIDLIAAVQKQQQQSGNHPITVHCRQAGPGRPLPVGPARATPSPLLPWAPRPWTVVFTSPAPRLNTNA